MPKRITSPEAAFIRHWRTDNEWHRREGAPWPLGATWLADEDAFNFAIYSKHATEVELLCFARNDYREPTLAKRLDFRTHKSGPIWHCRIAAHELAASEFYAYRILGPPPEAGVAIHHFDREKLLLDPYARDVHFPPDFDREGVCTRGSNLGRAPLGLLPRTTCEFDWQHDRVPIHSHDLIIYEMHVRGFTADPSSEVAPEMRGTFAGVIEKIPYLRKLGITAVELMPVFQFDPEEDNYWGYMPLNFFSPHERYTTAPGICDAQTEFRMMVRELHAAGIEVLLDVVYLFHDHRAGSVVNAGSVSRGAGWASRISVRKLHEPSTHPRLCSRTRCLLEHLEIARICSKNGLCVVYQCCSKMRHPLLA